ncbi:arrestin 3b, retinal (X-arrestin) isoform X2 [Corythoichthys intestinalis]|uniref:arrestin 3b, retinal (X-arrestin) isoform X2 n=1 Tax=Corythoichthys intestinalis TaxID=161448 RepID=UPI0025A56225|nr:arrestin 3b, retinal (X-arrestin) isoform X2 [Corythoichthys intestinalis]
MSKVFKKTSGNGHIALYLGKRDFVDNVDSVEVVDGVVKVDPSGLDGRKVFVYLACAFRYGSEDLDVIGLSCRKDIWINRVQVYPPTDGNATKSPMQESLLKKVGEQGCPFSFQMPPNLPCSVSLQPGPNDSGKACGVDFEVKAYLANEANSATETIEKKDTCRLMIRKIQFAPTKNSAGPKAEITKQFMMSDKPVHMEAALDKEVYCHGDPITVSVKINNETTKIVKKIQIIVEQLTNVVLYSSDTYTKTVLTEEFGETINANSTFEKTFQVTPLLANNKEKRGLSVDGRLKDEDTHLASTTLSQDNKEMQGIIVSYKVKVNLMVSGGGDVTVELPLTLMSPKPAGKLRSFSNIFSSQCVFHDLFNWLFVLSAAAHGRSQFGLKASVVQNGHHHRNHGRLRRHVALITVSRTRELNDSDGQRSLRPHLCIS